MQFDAHLEQRARGGEERHAGGDRGIAGLGRSKKINLPNTSDFPRKKHLVRTTYVRQTHWNCFFERFFNPFLTVFVYQPRIHSQAGQAAKTLRHYPVSKRLA